MTGLLNITANVIIATLGAANPAIADSPMHVAGCTDIPVITSKYEDHMDRQDVFGVDFNVYQMDRTSRLV